jgi:hypothetical protein
MMVTKPSDAYFMSSRNGADVGAWRRPHELSRVQQHLSNNLTTPGAVPSPNTHSPSISRLSFTYPTHLRRTTW